MSPALLVGGKLYTLGTMLQPLSLIYYNKDAFTKAGITQPPTTVAELTADMAALKTSGTVPVTTAGDSLAYIQWNSFTSADVFGQDPHWFTDRRAGTVHYAEGTTSSGPRPSPTGSRMGYFPKGAAGLTYDQSTKDFLDGKAGMIANGVWFASQVASTKTPFEVGVFPPRTRTPRGGWRRSRTVLLGLGELPAAGRGHASVQVHQLRSGGPRGPDGDGR